MTDEVLVSRTGAAGHLRLNRPAALNSLTGGMVEALHAGLDRHLADRMVQVIVLSGEGARGLCAGADIKMLADLGFRAPGQALAFWRREYMLVARIAQAAKPWVALMDGICMGGGAGLSMHGAHRVVTERTRFAMPETGIGYFPDVGATWALPRAPGMLGFWIGLTGATISAADVIAAGLADVMVPSASLPALVAALESGQRVADALAAHAVDPGPSALARDVAGIAPALAAPDMAGVMAALDADDSAFARETRDILATRSPASLAFTLHLLRAGAQSPDLAACLARELEADALFLRRADFYEGIRAAVIDRDRNPRWERVAADDLTAESVAGWFTQ
ncbi:MAG: enoyl-CoA hydratase/isomerase family protein [Rubellimicrobium sp.]|nr:enoyl-CoA hydratase/isomerase family protein [Rubellimicrobium sp.]